MKLVVIESPLSGDFKANKDYARKAMRDSLGRGEAPYASHLLYDQPGILDDTKEDERSLGMNAGFAWGNAAGQLTAVYIDRGISGGMIAGIQKAKGAGRKVEFRRISKGPLELQKPASVKQKDWDKVIASIPKELVEKNGSTLPKDFPKDLIDKMQKR